MKNYIKNNQILTNEDKVHFFTAINVVKKNAATVADADKAIFKKLMYNSVILTELKKRLANNL